MDVAGQIRVSFSVAGGSSDGDSQLNSPLGVTARRGARSSLMAQVSVQVGSVVATVILARLLTLADFGVVALSQSILGAVTLISVSGVNAALVTRKGSVDGPASSYFWLAAAVGWISVVIVIVVAHPLTSLLGQARASAYVSVLAFSIPLNLMSLIPYALLQRRFLFAWLNASIVSAAITYFALEIILAFAGMGAWCVVIGQIGGSFVGLVVAMGGARWLPRAHFSISELRADATLTAGLGTAQPLDYIQKNGDYWAVSNTLGGQVLGIYYVAYVLPNIVRLRITAVMRQVMLPALSAASSVDETARLWRRTFPMVFGLGLPLLVGIALEAKPIIALFFGHRWLGAVGLLRILTLGTVIDLLLTSVGTVAIVQRQMKRYLLILGTRAVLTIVFAFTSATVWGSATAVAWSVVSAAAITLLVQEVVLSSTLRIGLRSVARPIGAYSTLVILMVVTVTSAGRLLPVDQVPLLQLFWFTLVGSATYVGFGLVVFKPFMKPVLHDARRVMLGR